MAGTRTHKNEVPQARFLLGIAITDGASSPVLDRSSDVSGRGYPAHRNSSEKPYNNDDHVTTLGALLLAEFRPKYRDTISYKMMRG